MGSPVLMMQALWREVNILSATRSACARLHKIARLGESDPFVLEAGMINLS